MKIGICKECFANVPLLDKNLIITDGTLTYNLRVYECPECSYPNGIKCGDFWEIYDSNKIIQGFIDFFRGDGII